MAADDLSLLFRLRADNSQAKATLADTRTAIGSLRTSFGAELGQMQAVSQKAFGSIQGNLQNFVTQLPGGNVFVNISNGLRSLGTQSGAVASEIEGAAAATGTLGAEAAAVAGPIGIAVLAIGAEIAAVALLTKGIFSLAQEAADFRGKLFDLSQQTGVSVETLSALEIVAKTTGGSIEGISASLGIFQKHLEDAQDPTTKQAKLFDELGVSTNNTEDALRDTLTALAAMPTGFRQTATALELFGRGGKSILAILKETNGDLDGAIARFREMGLIVSREDAEAADKFNDQLALLGFQFRAMLGQDAIPAVLAVLQDLSKTLEDNKGAVVVLRSAIEATAVLFGTVFRLAILSVNVAFEQARPLLEAAASAYERIARASGQTKPVDLSGLTGGVGGRNAGLNEVGGGETDTREHRALTEREIENAAKAKKAADEARAAAKKAADEQKRDLEGQLQAFQNLNQELATAADAYQGIDTKTRVYAVTQEILNGALKNASEGLKEMALFAAANIDAIVKQIAAEKELSEFTKSESEAARQALEGDKERQQVITELIEKTKAEGGIVSSATEARLRMNAAIQDSIDRLKNLIEVMREQAALEADRIKIAATTPEGIAAAAGAAADAAAGLPPALDGFSLRAEAIAASIDTMRDAFSSLGQAIAQTIHSFVLFGNSGTSIRKFTAEVLASVAAQAAVKAVFELAEGFAALFFNPPAAAAHFTAAALYGSIAGIAALVGRGVAGNSFQRDANGDRSSSSGGNGGGPNGALQTIVQGRNQAVRHEHVLRIVTNDSHIVETVGKNWRDGGGLRELILNDGS